MATRQTWIRDGVGNLFAVLGEFELTSKIIGDKLVVSAKYPVLYRRNSPDKSLAYELKSSAIIEDTEPEK